MILPLYLEHGFALIALAICMGIVYLLKDAAKLSCYKSIVYFRNAFVFFGLSVIVKYLFLWQYTLYRDIAFETLFFTITFVLYGYFTLAATFYLLSSILVKFFNEGERKGIPLIIFFHIIAATAIISDLILGHSFIQLTILIVVLLVIVGLSIHHCLTPRGRPYIKQMFLLSMILFLVLVAFQLTMGQLAIVYPGAQMWILLVTRIGTIAVFAIILFGVYEIFHRKRGLCDE